MEGIILACYVDGITTRKDKSVSIKLSTQELSEVNAGQIFGLQSKLVAVYVSPKETIPQRDIDQVDKVDVEMNSKSQSQRIRAVLFKLWDQGNEGHKDFDAYYKAKTEMYIEHLKAKIL